MSRAVDLNADLGEGAPHERELLALVTSANIACGLHAGSAAMMRNSLQEAQARGVSVGAHPGFDDRENFGRREMPLGVEKVHALVVYQLGAFQALAHSLGMQPRHVKPHGALYNMAARDPAIAEAIVRGVRAVDPSLMVFAPGGSALARAAEADGLPVAREVFADRNYLSDGSLVPRERPDALMRDPERAADRVFRMLNEGKVRAIDGTDVPVAIETICVHGDTPGAVAFAGELRRALLHAGVIIAAPRRTT
ncbi:MAG: 5-oxoprolinase subunit PxpA [Chthoniobacterales bacterium]